MRKNTHKYVLSKVTVIIVIHPHPQPPTPTPPLLPHSAPQTSMDNSTVRAAICSVLAVACVIQTSLIVIFTVTHVQQQRQLQMSYDNLTQRARRLLLSCGGAQAVCELWCQI